MYSCSVLKYNFGVLTLYSLAEYSHFMILLLILYNNSEGNAVCCILLNLFDRFSYFSDIDCHSMLDRKIRKSGF